MINNSNALDKLFYSMPTTKLYKNKLHYIDIHIIDGCNHNCARCVKFAPLCKSLGIVNKKNLTKDIKQLARLTHKELDGISLIGGEPLISPDIIYYMKLCRKQFPNTAITIVTNGIAIPKMPKEFFKALQDYNVWLSISKFYDSPFYNNIIETLKLYDCYNRTVFQGLQPFNCVMFVQMDLDETGSQNKKEMFKQCPNKNGYITLKDGKLWSCPTSCMKYILNDYFKTSFNTYDSDGISIYNNDILKIINHLKTPKESCKYCTVSGLNRLYFPESTQYNKSEWIKNN